MLMIVAHHYVVNSGLMSADGPLKTDSLASNSVFLWLFGAWGKMGINCFVMITGYFMCTHQITMRKFLKLLLEIYLYRLLLFSLFLLAGYESFDLLRLFKLLMPFWGLHDDFAGCFLMFYLTIPFLSILVRNLSYNHFRLDENQKNPPLTISNEEMENFIIATCNQSEHLKLVTESQCHFKGGETVMVIDGPFKGTEGRVARVSGQQRVVLSLSNVGLISTAYIPTAFIRPIDKE